MKKLTSVSGKSTTASFVLAVVFSGFAISANASQGSGQFLVTATLLGGSNPPQIPAAPTTGFCIKNLGASGFGATVTVVCSTGAVVDLGANPWLTPQGGAYRYLYQISSGGVLLGTIDSYSGIGNETSWRVVDVMDHKYLEMQVGW
jgi:hypothetical protein